MPGSVLGAGDLAGDKIEMALLSWGLKIYYRFRCGRSNGYIDRQVQGVVSVLKT